MGGKVIDIDPRKRLTQEALETMQAFIASKTLKDIDSMTVIYRDKENGVNVMSYGLDFDVIGRAQTMLQSLGHSILVEEFTGQIDQE